MASTDFDVVVIGGGAAGVAAGRRLHDAGVRCTIVEARSRLGGRAWTVIDPSGHALDLGCGWLHSADRNPWSEIARAQGRNVDATIPPWQRPALPINFPLEEQGQFRESMERLWGRVDEVAEQRPDVAIATLLEPGNCWNALMNAASTYISGTEFDRSSARDLYRYEDDGVNWRVVEGYGTTVAAHGEGVPVVFDCPVQRIDHSGVRLRIETAQGTITCNQVIVTAPSDVIAQEAVTFTPALPAKVDAAAGLPLGLADKLFLSLENAEEFEQDCRLFARKDRAGTGAYQFRPFGRPQIEVYFGGRCAAELEKGGEKAFFDFAVEELTGVFGHAFAMRVKPIAVHGWRNDPFAHGSYSTALPGKADCRAALADPVDGRLFFAGGATSLHDFSTAHGAYFTGVAAADAVIAARKGVR